MYSEEYEKCANCRFFHKFYVPPTLTSEAIYKFCCSLFLDEANKIMYLDTDQSMCEVFTPKEESDG